MFLMIRFTHHLLPVLLFAIFCSYPSIKYNYSEFYDPRALYVAIITSSTSHLLINTKKKLLSIGINGHVPADPLFGSAAFAEGRQHDEAMLLT